MNDDAKEFLQNQAWKLTNSIVLANELADGKYKITKFSDPERLKLAEQFAQAMGILTLCVEVAKEKNKPPSIIEIYTAYKRVFTDYSCKACMLSGEFSDHDDMTNHLKGNAQMTIEHLVHYEIDPMKLHKVAMDTVEDSAWEAEQKKKWRRFGT